MPDIDVTVASASGLIAPVLALVVWSLIMFLWMYATRIPAMQKANIDLDNQLTPQQLAGSVPTPARWKADNYNHLMEQPTIFYAAALAAALAGLGDDVNVMAAWAYVILRVLHSLIQATVNVIMVRFLVFTLSTIALIVLAVRSLLAVI